MVSSRIVAATGDKARHILNRGLDNKYYQDMILELVREYSPSGRKDIDKLLMNKLPEILTDGQKKAKIHNLISELSRSLCVIRNIGSRRYPEWVLNGKNSRYEQARLKNNKKQ